MNFVLSSDRLILKPPQPADIAPWSELYSDTELTKFVGGAVSVPVARQRVLAAAGAWSLLGYGPFSAFERRTGDWIGCIGPAFLDDWPGHELGWRLRRGARGNGYATEGASLALDWAFASLGWSDVIHSIHPDNLASISVARRLGATDLGELTYPPGHSASHLLAWGQTASEWQARRTPGARDAHNKKLQIEATAPATSMSHVRPCAYWTR